MREDDWVPLSASALVIGAMALVFAALLNPLTPGQGPEATLKVVEEDSGRWIAMAAMYFFSSVTLTLGLPAMLTLFRRRGHRIGQLGIGLFSIGTIGTSGFAMLMVFFKALVAKDAIVAGQVDVAGHDHSLQVFLYVWVGCFYCGVLLIALSLLLARTVARWVPALLVVFVAMLPIATHLGRVGQAAQVLAFAVACTGIAMAAVSGEQRRALTSEPVF